MRKYRVPSKYKLPTTFEMKKGSCGKWAYDENWLSNGQFAVRRKVVFDDFKYCSPDVSPTDIERIHPIETPYQFIKTDRLLDYGDDIGYVRIFESSGAVDVDQNLRVPIGYNRIVLIKEVYAKFFNLEVLYGDGHLSPLKSHDDNVFVMPCRDVAYDKLMREAKHLESKGVVHE